MKDFVFITDLHLGGSQRVRTGSVVDDILAKVHFVVEYCNKYNAALLMGGDIFDKPSVPDYIKSSFSAQLVNVKNGVYSVAGNHSRLYDNPELTYKTSYQVLASSKVIVDLDSIDGVDFGNVYLTGKLPIEDKGKPQIVVYHGFLNKDDGLNSFYFTDIKPGIKHKVFVCLGHDHVVYSPYQYSEFVRVFRPGSLLRGIREDAQLRTPQLLHIREVNGSLQFKMVDIPCRDSAEIFTTKEASVDNKEKKETYEDVINQIKNAQKVELTFEDAVKQVASPDVFAYVIKTFDQAKLEISQKRQNL